MALHIKQMNQADDASRGLHVEALLKYRRWLHGPDFLWKGEESSSLKLCVTEDDSQ